MNVFLQVIQYSPLSSKIPFPYILSSLFFLADPSAVYSNLIHFCPARYSSTSNRLGNWSHTTCRFVYAEKRVGAYTDTWLFYLKILLMGKIVNLRNRTGEERRRQTLCDNRDNNFVWNNFTPNFSLNRCFCKDQKTFNVNWGSRHNTQVIALSRLSHTTFLPSSSLCRPVA